MSLPHHGSNELCGGTTDADAVPLHQKEITDRTEICTKCTFRPAHGCERLRTKLHKAGKSMTRDSQAAQRLSPWHGCWCLGQCLALNSQIPNGLRSCRLRLRLLCLLEAAFRGCGVSFPCRRHCQNCQNYLHCRNYLHCQNGMPGADARQSGSPAAFAVAWLLVSGSVSDLEFSNPQ
jgi:hypothetical protein